jgi:hypothetical protein
MLFHIQRFHLNILEIAHGCRCLEDVVEDCRRKGYEYVVIRYRFQGRSLRNSLTSRGKANAHGLRKQGKLITSKKVSNTSTK